jgi:hypothetical protein
MATTTAEQLLKKHLEIWSETDEEKRKSGIAEIYTNDVEFIDPFSIFAGTRELDHFIDELQSKNPGFVFTSAGAVNSHHHIASIFWHFGPPDKPDTVTGQDVVVLKDGRIQKLYAFIDGLPPQSI